MGESLVVSGLRRKRGQIAGFIAEHERQAREWRVALAKVDAVLKLFDPELDPTKIPMRQVPRRTVYYDGHQMTRLVLDELRKAGGTPISTDAIFAAAVSQAELPDQPHIRVSVRQRIVHLLNQKDKRGEIMRVGMGRNAKWALPPERLDSPEQQ